MERLPKEYGCPLGAGLNLSRMLLSTPWTSQPTAENPATTSDPIKPEEPVTKSFFMIQSVIRASVVEDDRVVRAVEKIPPREE